MRLSDELEFIRALPEEGCLILTDEEVKRSRLLREINNACGAEASRRVVISVVSRDEQMKLVRAKAFEGNRCWPRITAAVLQAEDDAAKLARMTAAMGHHPVEALTVRAA